MLLSAVFFMFVCTDAAIGQLSGHIIQAERLEPGEQIILDGRLDEEFWQRIPAVDYFLQQEPIEGGAPTERTEVRVAYDSNDLFIGVILYDSDPDRILAYELQRNASLGTDDRFMWILDTFGDGREAYFFETNPAGMMGDGLIRVGQGGGVDRSWDGVWDVRISRNDKGWSAEIRIPFHMLNFNEGELNWGINFQRTVRRKNEEIVWSGYRRNQGVMRPQNAGVLTGLENISQGAGLEIKPYGLASWRRTLDDGTQFPYNGGVDVTYSITTNLRGSLTVNTDFAEVEVDQRRVNLTRFPLMFPEQRDFFLEGSSVFRFAPQSQVDPYFSRSIGLMDGEPIPVVAGARVAGQAGSYDVGFIQVRTADTEITPTEDFTVARLRRNMFSESSIGVIYTRRATAEREDGTSSWDDRHTIGADLELETSRFRENQNLQLQLFFVGHTPALPDEESTLNDRSASGLRLAYPNDPVRGHVSYRVLGTHYDPAVGFVRRRAMRRFQPSVSYSPLFERSDRIRRIQFRLHHEYLMDLDYRPETVATTFTVPVITFESGDETQFEFAHAHERLYVPFDILRDGSIVIPPGNYEGWRWAVSAETASYRRLSAGAEYGREAFWTGSRDEYVARLTYRPISGIRLSGFWNHSNITLREGSFTSRLFRVSGSMDLTPFTSLSANIQYDNLSEIVGIYSRFRWIIRPGSDLYFVYTNNWLNTPGERISLDHGMTSKISYALWF